MAGDINQVVLIGRVTRDAELRYTSTGQAICDFSIAVNRRLKKGDQWVDEASFFDLSLWEKQAESLQRYLVKGTQVAVNGELRQDRWEKDGQKFNKIKIAVNSLQLLGSRQGTPGEVRGTEPASSPRYPEKSKSQPATEPDFDPQAYEDDIPF